MGDRCCLDIYITDSDYEKHNFCWIDFVDIDKAPLPLFGLEFPPIILTKVSFDDVNYGGQEVLDELVELGCHFVAINGIGDTYGRSAKIYTEDYYVEANLDVEEDNIMVKPNQDGSLPTDIQEEVKDFYDALQQFIEEAK